jgi:hypothetical protein
MTDQVVADNQETFATFDNFSEDELSDGQQQDAGEDDWAREDESKEAKEEKVKDDLKVLPDAKKDAEGKDIEEDKKEVKKEEKKVEKKEEEEDSEEEDLEDKKGEEKKVEEKKDSKKLRLRMGEELYNVDSSASVKVKVDGELQDVPLQELINNFSGKTAWDKKFTEIGKEKKYLEVEKSQLQSQKQELSNHVQRAIAPLKDPNANPLDSLMYLVEISGQDPYTAYRRIMEANLDEISTLMDMTETERELHFHKKKDELHSSVARKRQEASTKEQAFNQAVQKVDQLRQTLNVSEDDFVDASEELERIYADAKLDVKSITDEAIVDYASLKPHITTVKELVAPYEDNISEAKYGDVVASLARHLRDGKADIATVKDILKRNYSVEEDVKELNTKVYEKQGKKPTSRVNKEDESTELESFDDWN